MEKSDQHTELKFSDAELIFNEGDPGDEMYLIKKGKVRIFKTSGKVDHTLAILQEGNFFGEMAIIDQSPRSASAVAIDQVVLIKFNKDAFLSNIRKNPFIEFVVSELIKRLRKTSEQFKLLAIPDDRLRFATMLAHKAKSFSKQEQDVVVPISGNAQSLASASGVKVNLAQKYLEELEESELIEYKNSNLVIKDMEKFNEYLRYWKLKTKFEDEDNLIAN